MAMIKMWFCFPTRQSFSIRRTRPAHRYSITLRCLIKGLLVWLSCIAFLSWWATAYRAFLDTTTRQASYAFKHITSDSINVKSERHRHCFCAVVGFFRGYVFEWVINFCASIFCSLSLVPYIQRLKHWKCRTQQQLSRPKIRDCDKSNEMFPTQNRCIRIWIMIWP